MGRCSSGLCVVIYPEGVWYTYASFADIDEIINSHLVKGTSIERLKILASDCLFLSNRGYQETISYSFVDPQLQEAIYPDTPALQLLNPISQELSQMRAGMWPRLIASMIYNIHRQQTAIKFFETGVVFAVDGDCALERPCVAGLLTGEYGHLNWSESAQPYDFYDLKGDLQALFAAFDLDDIKMEYK